MSLLCVPTGSEGVQNYRFKDAELGQRICEKPLDTKFVRWLEKEGLDWEGFWTNAYSEESQAIGAIMREYDVPVIIDVDDHFDEVPKGNAGHHAWIFRKRKLYNAALKDADRRVCSTPWLADRHDGQVAPNFVKESDWDWPQRKTHDSEVVLLHCGSVNRAEDYLEREDSFRAFLDIPSTKIVFMGWLPKWAREYPVGRVVFCRWVDFANYKRMLRWIAPDLLVSPLIHNNFNLAKSNIKWLESAMVGACFVGERWGEYERTVTEGVTGFLASGPEEWTDTLRDLALSPDIRKQAAKTAREDVLKNWTWDAVRPMWERAVLGKGVSHGASRKWAASRGDSQRSAAAAG